MKKITKIMLLSVLSIFLVAGSANATIIDNGNPSDEEDLYQIWNALFGDSFASSQTLFDTYGLSDGSDYLWYETNGGIYTEVRYAGYGQSFGYRSGDVDTNLVSGIKPGWTYESATVKFDPNVTFNWFEKYEKYDGTTGKWYSDNTLNPDDLKLDHFVAFSVPPSLVKNYNSCKAIDSNLLAHDVYLLAFEDLANLGDKDYNDLVVLVDCVKPAPEPATMLLLGTGLIGLAAFGRKKFRGGKTVKYSPTDNSGIANSGIEELEVS